MTETLERTAQINGDFTGKDVVSIGQFSRDDVEIVMQQTATMAAGVREGGLGRSLDGMLIANLFYEPSTRTFLSFEAAAKRLGADTIATQGVEYSSISKGETLEDTIRTVERYADIITLRHSRVGAAAVAAAVAEKPVINAGDGIGEHPTQALLDLFTIRQRLGHTDGLRVTMVGDLKNGRTVHSLARLLAMHEVQLNYVSPKELAMPEALTWELADDGARQHATADLGEVLPETDVLYVTRIQKERFESEAAYLQHKGRYVIDRATMNRASAGMVLMHPLPRVGEISLEVDTDPRAAYFDQVENGMFVRMALLALIAGRPAVPHAARAEAANPAVVY